MIYKSFFKLIKSISQLKQSPHESAFAAYFNKVVVEGRCGSTSELREVWVQIAAGDVSGRDEPGRAVVGVTGAAQAHYQRNGNERQPAGLRIMLRVYFVQHWFNLSHPGLEEALYEPPALWRFVGVDLGIAAAPDGNHDLPLSTPTRKSKIWAARCWTW